MQCGLLERWSPGPLLTALDADPDDAQIARAAVGLHDLLGAPVAEAAVRAEVEDAFTRAPAVPPP